MKRLTIGILAHVDSGKTTLSEAMGHGALRVSSREFQAEVEKVLEAIRDYFNQI